MESEKKLYLPARRAHIYLRQTDCLLSFGVRVVELTTTIPCPSCMICRYDIARRNVVEILPLRLAGSSPFRAEGVGKFVNRPAYRRD
jgi:hypothetical protein